MDERLELTLFGSPEVRLAGKPLTGFRSTKARALLYDLAATRRAHPRSVLAGLFWGGVEDEYARRNLNRTLSNLIQLVGDHLIISRQTIAFARNRPYWLDVEALESALAAVQSAGQPDTLSGVVDLYRGDFLEGFHLYDTPEFEGWVSTERTRLRERYLHGLQLLGDQLASRGDQAGAANALRRVLKEEPWREETHRQLMLLLAQSGQRRAALAQFELCRQALASELKVEPVAATLELLARIRDGEFDKVTPGQDNGRWQAGPVNGDRVNVVEPGLVTPSPSPSLPAASPLPATSEAPGSPPHNLLLQLTPFIGRNTELAEIAQLFDEPDCRLLTLVGPGGMGKTRLALRAAERIVETHPQHGRFAQGVFFVPLEALREGNSIVSAIISAISDESGFPLHAAAPLQEQLLDFLHDKEMLLVLDNFEHLVSTAALLSTILRVAPAVKLLVTSREALGLQEEWFYPITGMSLPTMASDNLAAEVEYDAVRLFVQCARRTQPGFALAAGDQRAAMLRICQMVEGMPLAIELAAAWLMVLTPQQIVHELEHGLDILTARFQNVPVRHRSMRAVMEHSWNLLTGEEQEVAARLSVFLGGFHFAAAAEIAGASLPMLATLVEKALVRLTPDKRYQMHELVRQYFASHLQTNLQKEQATLDRHSAYYVHWLRQRGDWLRSDQQATALAEFALEADNIRAAWNRAVALRNREAMRSATFDLIDFYDWLSWFQEGEHLFAEAVQQLEESDARGSDPAQTPPALAYALLGFGAFSCRIGHYERAQEALRRTLAILRTGDDSPALSHTLYWLAMVGNHLGRYAEARLDAEEGLVLAERDNDHIMVARLLNLLAFVALFGGQYAQAEEQFARALATARRLGNQKLTILLLTNLSWSLRLQHKYEQTRQLLHESIALAEGIGERRLLAFAQGSMGQLAFELGEYSDAQRWFRQSLLIMQAIHESWGTTGTLNHLGQTALALGEIDEARRLFHELLKVAGEDGLPPRQLDALVGFAQLELFDGNLQQALELLTYVIQHSAVQRETKDQAERLRAELTAKMTKEQVAQVEVIDLAQPIAALVARYAQSQGVALPANPLLAGRSPSER